MRGFIAGFAVLVVAGSLTAQADKPYDSKEGRYSVAFPGKPTTDSKKAGELTLNTAAVEAKGVGYIVIHSDLPADTVKASKAEDILENGEKGLVMNFKAKVTKSQPTTFGKEKYPARNVTAEVKVDATTLKLRLLIVLANNRVYQVLAVGSEDVVGGPMTEKFFESFEIRK
ncbi:MAG: hypothetical protein C0467_19135 [Planctomycetaceae bacterium]|nr:hypothetical protein [Planctomycetaceae bacterium]